VNKSRVILAISMGLSLFGCSSSTEQAKNSLDMEKYPQKRSLGWCQKNYSSASVSTRERQSSAKHCDTEARNAYIEAKKNTNKKE